MCSNKDLVEEITSFFWWIGKTAQCYAVKIPNKRLDVAFYCKIAIWFMGLGFLDLILGGRSMLV